VSLPRELITPRDHRHGSKLGDVIRLLASNSQGEAFAALCAIARLLEAHRASFHDLAAHVENGGGGLSEDDKKKIRSEIDNMASRTVYGREPTPKQHRYLHFLFFKLGGKIT